MFLLLALRPWRRVFVVVVVVLYRCGFDVVKDLGTAAAALFTC
jgi:hypothetical protein